MMKSLLIIAAWIFSFTCFAQKTSYLLVGTYTTSKSKGIYVYEFNSKDGSSKLIDSVETVNPSYLAVSPDKKFVYAVNETNKGHVSSYSFDKKTGRLKFISQQSSFGDNPCYIAVDKKQKWAIVGNYSSGNAAVLPLNEKGSLLEAVDIVQHQGRGTNASRQEAAHVHSTVFSPDNNYVFISDLGIDKIMIYPFSNDGQLSRENATTVKLPDGSGPRHFVFHPSGKWAYLVQELSGTVTAFHYEKGKLDSIQMISTLPSDFHSSFTSADIHVSKDGNFLYASNRDSSNTIAVFRIDKKQGTLTSVGDQSTLGKTPRNFNFDPSGNFLLAANQNSDEIVVFRIDKKTGLLTDTGKRMAVGKPVCLKWIER